MLHSIRTFMWWWDKDGADFGVFFSFQPTNDVTEDEFDKVFLVNVKSIYYSANVVVPYMQKQGSGKIINVSSNTPYKTGK